MIETYKIISGKERVDPGKFFQMANFRGRAHPKKIYKKNSRLNIRKYWFTQRVVDKWNGLLPEVVEANKSSSFKARYDRNEARRRTEERSNAYSPWDTLFSRIKLVSGVFIYQNKGNFLEIYVINVNKLFSVTFYFMKLFNIFYYPIFSQIMGGHHMFFHVIH